MSRYVHIHTYAHIYLYKYVFYKTKCVAKSRKKSSTLGRHSGMPLRNALQLEDPVKPTLSHKKQTSSALQLVERKPSVGGVLAVVWSRLTRNSIKAEIAPVTLSQIRCQHSTPVSRIFSCLLFSSLTAV